MSNHEDAAKRGREAAKGLLASVIIPHQSWLCPSCFAAAFSAELLSSVLAAVEDATEEELFDYLGDVFASTAGRLREKRKEAGHEDPPKSPDQRTLN